MAKLFKLGSISALVLLLLVGIASAHTITGDVLTEENDVAKVTIQPHTCYSPIGDCTQTINITNKGGSEETFNLATLFAQELPLAKTAEVTTDEVEIPVLSNTCTASISINGSSTTCGAVSKSTATVEKTIKTALASPTHTTYNDTQAYSQNFAIDGGATKSFVINYKTNPSDNSKKYDILLWKGSMESPDWSLYVDPWWNNNWTTKKCLNLNNSDTVAWPVNTTLNVTFDTAALISGGKMQSACQDLRIIYGGTTEVSYVFTPKDFSGNGCNSNTTMIAFLSQAVQSASTLSSGDYCFYYGNPSAPAPSYLNNGSAYRTFDSFNRANGATLGSAEKGATWTEFDTAGTVSIVSNQVQIERTGDGNPGLNISLDSMNTNSAEVLSRVAYKVGGSSSGTSETMHCGLWKEDTPWFRTAINIQALTVKNTADSGSLGTFTSGTTGEVYGYSADNSTNQLSWKFNSVLQGTTFATENDISQVTKFECLAPAGGANPRTWLLDDFRYWVQPRAGTLSFTFDAENAGNLIKQSTYNVTTASSNGTVWRLSTSNNVNTTDPTPTVTFNTTDIANCSISKNNWNYTAMVTNDSTTKCGTVDTTNMSCTLPDTQALAIGAQSIYIACRSASGDDTSNSGALAITFFIDEPTMRSYMDSAITNVLGNPTIYTDQQIYLRRLNGSQYMATYDKVAVSGQQRWAFNFLTGSDAYQNVGNLTPVLYTYETTNISTTQLQTEIEEFIRATQN